MNGRTRKGRARGRYSAAPPSWFTRARALLAGALVLGVGGTLTLAAWTDTEIARGAFTASQFAIEGSTDGSTFSEHPSSGPAALSFSVNSSTMSPGATSYARFVVRTTSATNVAGAVALGGATVTGTGLGAFLKYGVRTIPAGAACDATSFASGAVVVPNDSALSVGATGAQPLVAAAGAVVAYCFAVSLPPGTSNAAQGLNASATWTLTATSAS
ncbi:SipW-dependent-type signal peptide-containing protein [Leucobacter albus]|uniref:SipW-dependent-type signal peptide-containing protein n=1 Tax=Leucobacter albus TaxID=272210 RepID=A0ABW3TPN9_9MICO